MTTITTHTNTTIKQRMMRMCVDDGFTLGCHGLPTSANERQWVCKRAWVYPGLPTGADARQWVCKQGTPPHPTTTSASGLLIPTPPQMAFPFNGRFHLLIWPWLGGGAARPWPSGVWGRSHWHRSGNPRDPMNQKYLMHYCFGHFRN